MTNEFRAQAMNPDLDRSGVMSHQVEFMLQDVAIHLKPAVDSYMVQRLNLGFSAIESDEMETAINQGAPIPTTNPEQFEV